LGGKRQEKPGIFSQFLVGLAMVSLEDKTAAELGESAPGLKIPWLQV
jgi:hypothetical protein